MFSPLIVLVNNLAALQAMFIRTFLGVLGAPMMNWFWNSRTIYLMDAVDLKLDKDLDGARRVEFVVDTTKISKDIVKVKSSQVDYLVEKPSDTWMRDKRGQIEYMLLSFKKVGESKISYSKISVRGVRKEDNKYMFKGKFANSDSECYGDMKDVRVTMYLVNESDDVNSWWDRSNLSFSGNNVESDSDQD
tara:strand:+ start:4271 stop:4840 length:570 start_codon:yes stop_codon:yes gene_type:complete